MEISTNLKLCLLLVSSAIKRCRLSQNLCRLSVSVKRFSSPTVFRVSISDTGIGSCVEEFKSFKCAHGFIAGNNSDGVLSIATTRISDDEVRNYQINLMETVPARRLCVLPSQPKHGGRFSGTEVSFATAQDISGLLPEIACFLKKMQIPGIPVFSVHFQKDSIDVMVQHYIELIREDPVVANGCDPPPDASNIERLKSGLEDYVLRHGYKSDTKCLSCFPDHRDHLKVGSGMAYCMEGQRNAGLIVEAVVVISDSIDPSSPCFREFGTNTEVVLFNDFSPSLLTQTSQNALTKMDWKCYGLTLGNVLDLDGHALLEWENLPPSVHIDIVLHCYQSLYPLWSCLLLSPSFHRVFFINNY
uniref:Uncharacterized protein n=1 Tax=Kalanchoe fedtschenkoi TaxID=63787 RepID=A0A7N1A5V7_KALFE